MKTQEWWPAGAMEGEPTNNKRNRKPHLIPLAINFLFPASTWDGWRTFFVLIAPFVRRAESGPMISN